LDAELLTLLFTPPLAQTANGGDYNGAVGHLVSAALQTKGLVDQAYVLESLSSQIEWIAAFGWLISIAMGIASVAIFGNYRQGSYLLLGPPLFFYMITATVETDGVKSTFRAAEGQESQTIGAQRSLLEWIRAIDSNGGTASISLFYSIYDSIISEGVQEVVKAVSKDGNRSELREVAREYALSTLFQENIFEPNLLKLIHTHHVGDCGSEFTAFTHQAESRKELLTRFQDTTVIDATAEKAKRTFNKKNIQLLNRVKQYVNSLEGLNKPFTCEDGKCDDNQQPSSCLDIWNYTKAGLVSYATNLLSVENYKGSEQNADENLVAEAISDLRSWMEEGGNQANATAAQVLAVYLYRNTMTLGITDQLQTEVLRRAAVGANQRQLSFGSIGNAQRRAGLMKFKYFSAFIPYLQGLLLYLLSVAFPFFAIFLVLPGKATSFLVWCSLWAWVKSWDIGFALVNVARDIYWHMIRSNVNFHGAENVWQQQTPEGVMQMAFQNDPLSGQTVYWLIISALTVMVPVVTGHLAMGANQVFDMFSGSIDRSADRFSSRQGNSEKRNEASKFEQAQDSHQALTNTMGATLALGHNDPQTMTGTPLAKNILTGNQSLAEGLLNFNPKHDAATDSFQNYVISFMNQFSRQVHISPTAKGGYAQVVQKVLDREKAAANYNALRETANTTSDATKAEKLHAEADKMLMEIKHGNKPISKEEQAKVNSGGYHKFKMAEKIGHAERGFLYRNEAADTHSLKTWSAGLKNLANELRKNGFSNRAASIDKKVESLDKKIEKNVEVKVGEIIDYQHSLGNSFQHGVVATSGRRTAAVKGRYKASKYVGDVSYRVKTALNARNHYSSADQYINIFGDNRKAVNLEGAGSTVGRTFTSGQVYFPKPKDSDGGQ